MHRTDISRTLQDLTDLVMRAGVDGSSFDDIAKAIGDNTIVDRISELYSTHYKLGCPRIVDGEPVPDIVDDVGETRLKVRIRNTGRLAGDRELICGAMDACADIHRTIVGKIATLATVLADVEDLALGFANAFSPEYDPEMFNRAWAYQAKFINGSNSWMIPAETCEAWKSSYDAVVSYFKEITRGLDTHNLCIRTWRDGSMAELAFTVAGCPGDFEIAFPLVSSEDAVAKYRGRGETDSMKISATWRGRYLLPHRDHFFERRSYNVNDVVDAIREFVRDETWRTMYNTKTRIETVWVDGKRMTLETPYTDEKAAELEREIADEIEANGKEGKYGKAK